MATLDQFHDPSFRLLYDIIQEYPDAEQHFKTAKLDLDEQEKRASCCFAWEEERLFPIDSPDQAALSRFYMQKQANVPAAVVERCDKALELYGVELSFPTEKTAELQDDLSDYLLPEMKRFRVRTAEDVKLAASAVLTHHRQMNPQTRAKAAVNLVKKALAHDVVLPVPLYKAAGLTACHVPTMRDWLEARAEAAEDPAFKTAYRKLAQAALNSEKARVEFLNDRDELIKVADALFELDEASGLQRHYDKRLPDPMETVFNTDKIAEETLDLAGKSVALSKLLSIDPDTYRNAFGEDLANDFISGDEIDPEQLKVILPTVPLDLQQALAAQMGV